MIKYYDPYDIWSLSYTGKIKYLWSQKKKTSYIILPPIVIMDLLFPVLLRRTLGIKKSTFPHVTALEILKGNFSKKQALDIFIKSRTTNHGWGLPFKWYSKNGIYDKDTPYITNTPYVMEALLEIKADEKLSKLSTQIFNETWFFLNQLLEIENTENLLCLSYSPKKEPRTVINANSYAALAYALHFKHGSNNTKEHAKNKCIRIVNWIISRQKEDGQWWYYDDSDSGNFTDCFHSCFIIKNLIKIRRIFPTEDFSTLDSSIQRGWNYIQENFFDHNEGLCKRFSHKSHQDFFKFDLYDQAEYLGLLIDFNCIDSAVDFGRTVESRFTKKKSWYCKIDIFNRKWGKDFHRWGIAPFLYQKSRLEKIKNF